MDPNVALANLRNMMKARIFQTHTHAVVAREAFEALDGWLMRGGFLPQDWADAQEADHAALRAAITRVYRSSECLCHKDSGSHEACCGHEDGRNPDCPQHGDGSTSG